jgi:hypothetical protein
MDLAEQAAVSDTKMALDLVNRIPDEKNKRDTLQVVIRSWSSYDPVAASEWLAQQPASRTRDFAIRELVLSSKDDPEIALANAAAISDPKVRLDAARDIVKVWRDIDEQALRAYLSGSSLSGPEQALLLEKP